MFDEINREKTSFINYNQFFNYKSRKPLHQARRTKSPYCNCYCYYHRKNEKKIKTQIVTQIKKKNALNIKKPKLIKFEAEKTKISIEENNVLIKSRNYSFKGKKTLQNKEISFDIIVPQIKNQIKLQKENIDDIQFYDPRKWNNNIIDNNNYFNILNQKKNNDSFLTQETRENFSISSLNKSKDIISEDPKGLNNFSINDYMNSLLQCFYHIKGLRTGFIDPLKYSSDNQKVCHSLSEVMKGLTYGKEDYYSPNCFKQALGNINSLFSGFKNVDINLLYKTVINSILNEIPYKYHENEDYKNKRKNYEEAKCGVDPNNPINKELNFFYETIYNCPKGNKCYSIQNNTSIMFNLFKISQSTKGKIDLYKCFDYNFRVIQNNQFYCSKCECTHKSQSQDKLLSLPNVLTINLNRGKGKQFIDKIEFYEKINIQKYVDDTFIDSDKKKFNYKLIAVSIHFGPYSNFGQYIAYCYRENEKKYYCFNDTSVCPVKFKDLKNNGEPCILFYEQINEELY